jgi:hypothetical protein
LDIYTVTSLYERQSFEAQAFSLPDSIAEKLLRARTRRMKRLFQSPNFVCEIRQAGKRFLISDVERSDAERRNLYCQPIDTQVPPPTSRSREEFPDLAGSRCSEGSMPSDSVSRAVLGGFSNPRGRNEY